MARSGAIDDVAREPYVDRERLGAIGPSFGGFSVFWLAGHHAKRFSTFVAHAGVFNFESMYGTTEELFFVNWDVGGPFWMEPRAMPLSARAAPIPFPVTRDRRGGIVSRRSS